MGALESSLLKRAGPAAGARTVIAVVSDATSKETIDNYTFDQGIASALVMQGSLDDTIGIMAALKEAPRYLVVDISGSEAPVQDLSRLAEVVDPSVMVVAIGERNDIALFRSLLQIGVRDYLVKPLTVEQIQHALTSHDAGAPTRTGRALSFVGARGGVGVTTIATALAFHLADKTRRRIAYVDLDPYGGGAAAMLGVSGSNGLIELLQNPQRLDDQLIKQSFVAQSDRLFVLASEYPYNNDLDLRAGTLTALVKRLKRHFHYVMLDLPVRAGGFVDELFSVSDAIHVVADRSVHSAREAARLCRFAETRDNDPDVHVLLNEARQPVKGRVQPDDFTSALARGPLRTFPHDPQTLALAENLAQPLPDAHDSPFAAAVVSLANALTDSGAELTPRASWLRRLIPGRRTR